jgi:hypothetical protein
MGGAVGYPKLSQIRDWPSTVSATEVGYLDGVTSGIQSQLDGKAATSHNHTGIYALLVNGVTNGDSHDHAGGDGAQIAYSGLSGIPSTFAPAAHDNSAHSEAYEIGGVAAGLVGIHAALTGSSAHGATATPTASQIPVADGSGDLADGWLSPNVPLLANTANSYTVTNGTTVVDGTGNTGTDKTLSHTYEAFTFNTGDNTDFGHLRIKPKRAAGNSYGNQSKLAYIYTDNAGVPGTLVATANNRVFLGAIGTAYGTTAIFSFNATLTANTDYWVVVYTMGTYFATLDSEGVTPNGWAYSADGTNWTNENGIAWFSWRTTTQVPISSSSEGNDAVSATSTAHQALYGGSTWGDGVHGLSTGWAGVKGESTYYCGTYGSSDTYFGAFGHSRYGCGGAFRQAGVLEFTHDSPTMYVYRQYTLGAYDATGPLLQLEDLTTSTGGFFHAKNASGSTVASLSKSGLLTVNQVSSDAVMDLQVAGVSKATLTNGGLFGLGISPESVFHAAANGSIQFTVDRASDNANAGVYALRKARGTLTSKTIVAASDVLGVFSFQGWDGSNWRAAAGLYAMVDTTPGASDMPGALIVAVTADGAASYTEACRWSNNGYMGLGTLGTAFSKLELAETKTITGATTNGYSAGITLDPAYTASSAQTVACHNYLRCERPATTNVTVTDGALVLFDAAAGTHEAVGAAAGLGNAGWPKININGTLAYIPVRTAMTAESAHINDPTDLPTALTAIASIIDCLEAWDLAVAV